MAKPTRSHRRFALLGAKSTKSSNATPEVWTAPCRNCANWRAEPSSLHTEAMFRAGEASRSYVLGICLCSRGDHWRQFGIALDESRLEVGEDAEDIVGDEDLAVAGRRRADADRRDRHGLGNSAGDR